MVPDPNGAGDSRQLGMPLAAPLDPSQLAPEKPSPRERALEIFLKELWRHRGKAEPSFVKEGLRLADELGVIDQLTPRLKIYRHGDHDIPGELRVKLASAGVVLAEASLREAPKCKVITEIPLKDFAPGMEPKIAAALFPRLVQILFMRAQSRTKPRRRIITP